MTADSLIKITIGFNDPDPQERDQQAQRLIAELKKVDEVDQVSPVADPNPPQGSKVIDGFLIGLLMAEVNPANAKKLLKYLGERLGGKPVELTVEGHGKKLTVKANSLEEMKAAIQAAQDFLKS